MKLTADYHIHSNNSKFAFGRASIENIARKANSLGLEEIAISDHGFKHRFAADKNQLLKNREVVNKISDELGINVLLGIEADVISKDGTIDIDDETLKLIDVLIIGYHKMIKTDFASYFGKQKDVEDATDAFINAIERYDVDIVAHPGHGVKLNLYRLGQVCAKNNVLIEINNRHVNFSEQDIKDLLVTGCYFVLSSDAYYLGDVGNVSNAMKILKKYNIPSERVVNVEYNDLQKTDLERAMEEDIERYNKLARQKYERLEQGTLSSETERKLDEIAKKKGLKNKKEDNFKIDPLDLLSDEEREVLRLVQEKINKK